MRNAMTIDVEEYFHVSAFASHIAPQSWERWPSRIEYNMERVLALLAERQIHATFFTLGWIAERHPHMIRNIVAGGHELASHGYGHQRATAQSCEQFAQDIRHAREVLEQTGACSVKGYRAPSFSIGHSNSWAWQALADAGYRYSSSIYPIRHDHYGMPDGQRYAWQPSTDVPLLELPISTVRLAGTNFPAGGGGYFRLLPYRISHWSLQQINCHEGRPAVFYLHPWEFDAQQPRVQGLPLRSRVRHYLNLNRTEARFKRLLIDFEWDRVDRIFLELQP